MTITKNILPAREELLTQLQEENKKLKWENDLLKEMITAKNGK